MQKDRTSDVNRHSIAKRLGQGSSRPGQRALMSRSVAHSDERHEATRRIDGGTARSSSTCRVLRQLLSCPELQLLQLPRRRLGLSYNPTFAAEHWLLANYLFEQILTSSVGTTQHTLTNKTTIRLKMAKPVRNSSNHWTILFALTATRASR